MCTNNTTCSVKDYNNTASVLFRVDASKDVALGHLKRCVSLAYKLREHEILVSFLTIKDNFTEQLLRESGFEHVILSPSTNSDDDCVFTIETAVRLNKEIIIVDSYQIEAAYRKRLIEQGFFTVSFDDMADRDIPSHIIINGNLNAERLKYQNENVQAVFMGIKYLILAVEFWDIRKTKDTGSVENVLITMGGIDHYDLTSKILAILDSFDMGFDITVIVGPYYENLDLIQSQLGKMKRNVTIVSSPPSLYPYMQKCSLAFSAGGQTLYELAVLGTPTIGITLWENQGGNVRELSRNGAIKGILYSEDENFSGVLRQAASELIFDSSKRQQLSQTAAAVVDGKGAERTYNAVINSYKKWTLSNCNKENA